MKIIALLLALGMLTACSDNKVIAGREYETYGLFNQDEVKAPNVRYKIVVGNVVWSVLLAETIVAPLYFIGFDLFEPVELADCTTHFAKGCR
jgi:hypothetical protein